MSETKFMDIKEFRDKGFLQEVNRRFFHPLGLALAINVDWPKDTTDEEIKKYNDRPIEHPNAVYTLHAILDSREDPEGFCFGDLTSEGAKEKAHNIDDLMNSKLETRLKLFGSCVQPIGHKFEDGK